jgi:hypothetical protein
LKALRQTPLSAGSLHCHLAKRGISRPLADCVRLLYQLVESGAVVVT